jgi:lipopolysaccharide/colanic/teichoic acid biosynthesis glycosyltransferase
MLIKIDSPGSIFYKQERIGKNFRPFFIYKFRTMVKDGDKKGLQITVGGDNRVTRFGKMLRKAKLDEFPQLINVLKGEMSLVGPRPEVKKYVDLFKEEYEDILKVRPGITDISSITFRKEEEVLKNQVDPEAFYQMTLLPEKIRLAKEYIENISFFYDLVIVFKTLNKIFLTSTIPQNISVSPDTQKSSTLN